MQGGTEPDFAGPESTPIYRRPAVIGKIAFYMIYCLFQFGGLFALNLFIQPYALDRNFTSKDASYLLSINGALDLIGEIVESDQCLFQFVGQLVGRTDAFKVAERDIPLSSADLSFKKPSAKEVVPTF